MDDSFCTYRFEEVAAVARPKTGETPKHNVRVPDPLWIAATEKAKAEGRTITDVLVAALHRYVAGPKASAKKQGDDSRPDALST